jgi:hypothetical protein
VTVVAPNVNVLGALFVIVTGATPPVAVAVPMVAFVHTEIVTAAGTVSTSGLATVTVNEP